MMASKPVSKEELPYINEDLLKLAQRGIRCLGDDLVMYLDLGGMREVLASDRTKFLSIVESTEGSSDGLCDALREPARVKAAREGLLRPGSVVFWFVWVTRDGETRAKILVLKNQPNFTTNQIGLA